MFMAVVLFFIVCAMVALALLLGKAVRARTPLDHDTDEQNLHTRYSAGEFSSDEYRDHLSRVRPKGSVRK